MEISLLHKLYPPHHSELPLGVKNSRTKVHHPFLGQLPLVLVKNYERISQRGFVSIFYSYSFLLPGNYPALVPQGTRTRFPQTSLLPPEEAAQVSGSVLSLLI